MATRNIIDSKDKIKGYLQSRRLREAMRELRALAGSLSWTLQEDVDKVEESYRMMLQYAVKGVEDPGRQEVYDHIIASLYGIMDRVVREVEKADSSALYFNTLRYENMQPGDSVASLIGAYEKLCDNSSLYNLIIESQASRTKTIDMQREKEQMERRIFNRVWVEYPLTVGDTEAMEWAFSSEALPDYFKSLLVSALMLGLIAYYDERRLLLLLNVYQSAKEEVAMRALCAAMLAMYIHRNRLGLKVTQRVALLKDVVESWHEDVKRVFMQFIRARDTERINRKMQDELIPSMLKLRPDIYKKINDNSSIIDLSQLEENPEWQELLDKSGITDKMKELSRMQEDGGDVFMSTFAHLKHYPFFSEIANWFLPFHIDHSELMSSLSGEDSVAGEVIAASPFLCSSDKYSICLSLSSIPSQQRQMMMSQFSAHNINAAEIRNAELLADDARRDNVVNKYVQDVYRFFKLFRRKREFSDPFDMPLNMLQVPVLISDFDDVETLSVVAEFYFKRGYYSDAYDLFSRLSEKMPPSAQLFQKMGYCKQQDGQVEKALQYYEQAELLNAQSVWTLRRIAACYKLLGRPAKALEYFKRVVEMTDSDLAATLNVGHCLMELGRYEEALRYYFKVEFLDEKSTRAWRPIAWCALLGRDFKQSRRYYDKVMTDAPTAGDFLNMGHLELATGNVDTAVEKYKQSVTADGGNVEAFISSMEADKHYLEALGVDISSIPLLIDALLYELS